MPAATCITDVLLATLRMSKAQCRPWTVQHASSL